MKKKRESVYKKHIEAIIKTTIAIYFIVAVVLSMNDNFETIYFNILGLLMIATPLCIAHLSE